MDRGGGIEWARSLMDDLWVMNWDKSVKLMKVWRMFHDFFLNKRVLDSFGHKGCLKPVFDRTVFTGFLPW